MKHADLISKAYHICSAPPRKYDDSSKERCIIQQTDIVCAAIYATSVHSNVDEVYKEFFLDFMCKNIENNKNIEYVKSNVENWITMCAFCLEKYRDNRRILSVFLNMIICVFGSTDNDNHESFEFTTKRTLNRGNVDIFMISNVCKYMHLKHIYTLNLDIIDLLLQYIHIETENVIRIISLMGVDIIEYFLNKISLSECIELATKYDEDLIQGNRQMNVDIYRIILKIFSIRDMRRVQISNNVITYLVNLLMNISSQQSCDITLTDIRICLLSSIIIGDMRLNKHNIKTFMEEGGFHCLLELLRVTNEISKICIDYVALYTDILDDSRMSIMSIFDFYYIEDHIFNFLKISTSSRLLSDENIESIIIYFKLLDEKHCSLNVLYLLQFLIDCDRRVRIFVRMNCIKHILKNLKYTEYESEKNLVFVTTIERYLQCSDFSVNINRMQKMNKYYNNAEKYTVLTLLSNIINITHTEKIKIKKQILTYSILDATCDYICKAKERDLVFIGLKLLQTVFDDLMFCMSGVLKPLVQKLINVLHIFRTDIKIQKHGLEIMSRLSVLSKEIIIGGYLEILLDNVILQTQDLVLSTDATTYILQTINSKKNALLRYRGRQILSEFLCKDISILHKIPEFIQYINSDRFPDAFSYKSVYLVLYSGCFEYKCAAMSTLIRGILNIYYDDNAISQIKIDFLRSYSISQIKYDRCVIDTDCFKKIICNIHKPGVDVDLQYSLLDIVLQCFICNRKNKESDDLTNNKILAFTTGYHKRLGAHSLVSNIPDIPFRMILDYIKPPDFEDIFLESNALHTVFERLEIVVLSLEKGIEEKKFTRRKSPGSSNYSDDYKNIRYVEIISNIIFHIVMKDKSYRTCIFDMGGIYKLYQCAKIINSLGHSISKCEGIIESLGVDIAKEIQVYTQKIVDKVRRIIGICQVPHAYGKTANDIIL